MVIHKSSANRKELIGQLFPFAAWLFITSIGLALQPDPSGHGTHMQLGLPNCPMMMLFHRPCPGCGLTTSFTALLHGHFAEAFHAHWFGPILYVGLTIYALLGVYGFMTNWRFVASPIWANRASLAFLILFLAYSLVRFILWR